MNLMGPFSLPKSLCCVHKEIILLIKLARCFANMEILALWTTLALSSFVLPTKVTNTVYLLTCIM